jgi:hypothetical protein
LESVLGNDAIDRSFADMEVTLSEFLSDDFGTGFGIQETMADDLTNHFLGAPVVGFGTPFGAKQSAPPLFEKEGSDLEVTLAAKTEFRRCAVNSFRAALSLDEHGELAGYFIGFGNGEGPGFTLDAASGKLERNHANSPRRS